ncbi:MAG: hypothetical protein A2511_09255 [Deltaproteobacteria bacterium RIFOXYD12_FULL_50_9]|nr:MAG: hypothetical protein A2511_09255 [Deltaproteobacteria bacterium RIFOXYD12_FULL_50_9]
MAPRPHYFHLTKFDKGSAVMQSAQLIKGGGMLLYVVNLVNSLPQLVGQQKVDCQRQTGQQD